MGLIDVKVNFRQDTRIQCRNEDCATNDRPAPC